MTLGSLKYSWHQKGSSRILHIADASWLPEVDTLGALSEREAGFHIVPLGVLLVDQTEESVRVLDEILFLTFFLIS